jgi:hypothetical protein
VVRFWAATSRSTAERLNDRYVDPRLSYQGSAVGRLLPLVTSIAPDTPAVYGQGTSSSLRCVRRGGCKVTVRAIARSKCPKFGTASLGSYSKLLF